MTDKEELLPAPSSNGKGMVMPGYCSITAEEWAA